MKTVPVQILFVAASALCALPAFADVEAFDDNIMCDFTIIGWTKQSLIDRKLAKNNFDDLLIKAKNHCSGKVETLQFAIGSGNIVYSKDTGVVRVDGSFKNPGDKDWTTRNLKIKDESK